MAQALFDEHPLRNYLEDVGESTEPIPGGLQEFAVDHVGEQNSSIAKSIWMPSFMLGTLRHVSSHASSSFVERFQYNVISSSLLSASTHPHHHGIQSPPIPGRLSPAQRVEGDELHIATTSGHAHSSVPHESHEMSWIASVGVGVFAVILTTGYYMLAILWIAGAYLYCMYISNVELRSKPAMLSTLNCLNDLIASGDVWDSVVHDAISLLEKEEQNIFGSPTNPTSPSSPLRVALHSTLHTTQTQCDNIRQLFSALTSPSELSQLSEMYAPPSPVKPGFSEFRDSPRPLSLPGSRIRTFSTPSDDRNKRSTWNGSYSSLALAGSPTMQILKRREKRRSEISSLLEATEAMRAAVSAPVSPAVGLSNVQEEEDIAIQDTSISYFGVEALDLQRKRRTSGLESFRLPVSSGIASSSSSRFTSPTLPSASRFTTMHTNRHPLSLSALHHALQGAFASKRYACAHLLALRFGEEEEEGYWEDVRSVMGLLITTLVDESSRLTEAIEDSEQARLKDEIPGADSLPSHSRSASLADITRRSITSQMLSFAPVPSHLARFAGHVDTISSALTDAREHLEQCVTAVHAVAAQQQASSSSSPTLLLTPPRVAPHENPAVQAYERLRRELGLALRECERGRERLLDIVSPPQRHPRTSIDGYPDDLPGLGQDVGSDESDKQDPTSPFLSRRDIYGGPEVEIGEGVEDGDDLDTRDDVTSHLLQTASSQHLPPPGIEQVFEADSGPGVLFPREKSKLTREERIKLAKARRESGGGLHLGLNDLHAPTSSSIERWGPGGEVVQELKDVIWKVGERRRKMTDGQFPVVVAGDHEPF